MTKIKAEQYIIFIIIMMFALLPPLIYTLAKAQTLSIGMMGCSIICVIACRKELRKLLSPKAIFLYLGLALIIYILLQHLIVGIWTQKSYASIPIIIMIFSAAYICAQKLLSVNSAAFKKAIYYVYYTCCGIAAINIATQYDIGAFFGYTHPKSMFPFLEPSHFATFFGVFFLIFFVSNIKTSSRIYSIAFTLVISMLIPNTTMLAYIAIALAILMLSSRSKKIILMIPILIASMLALFTIISADSYFTDRVNFSIDNTNTSALVYMQGFDDTKNSLAITDGLGLGFQMLGTQPASVYSYAIAKSMGSSSSELNRSDGGFFAAKLISEFGAFGIILTAIFIAIIGKSIFKIRSILNKNKENTDFITIAAYTSTIAFSVEFFVRGAGYFSPGFFIFLVSLAFIKSKNTKSKTKQPILTN